jgi:hypothetical protein
VLIYAAIQGLTYEMGIFSVFSHKATYQKLRSALNGDFSYGKKKNSII